MDPQVWLAIAGLASLSAESAKDLSNLATPRTLNFCGNHDDGVTPAVFECADCAADPLMHQFLCAECDGFMHLHKSRRDHSRGLVREKRDEMAIDVKDGTARLKCAVAVLAVDLTSGKAVLELKSNASTAEAGGSASCRFCAAALVGDRIVPGRDGCCSDPDCLALDERACTEKLGCGHLCGGVVDEAPEVSRC